jgi:exonuclease III
MAKFLQLTLWNANGLSQHTEELKTFISIHYIDVMLISDMHFTEKSYLKVPNYTTYHTDHPVGTARGSTAIIIKNCIKHHQLNSCSQDFLQVTSVLVEDSVSLLTILAVYLPPRYTVKQEQFEDFYKNVFQLNRNLYFLGKKVYAVCTSL